MGFIGGYFYFTIIKRFGAVVAMLSACFRKVLTLVLSFVLFPKPFTWLYLFSGAMVFIGFLLHYLESNRARIIDAWATYLQRRKGIDDREW